MKFFHISDLHIGLRLLSRDMLRDQRYILTRIVDAAEKERPDAVLIAGDIYDKAIPSAEAVEVFDSFIRDLTERAGSSAVMIISGNHDSGLRINCYSSILSRQNLFVTGVPPQTEGEFIRKVVLEDEYGPVNFYMLPFVRPSMVKRLLISEDEGEISLSYEEALRRLIGREDIDTSQRNVIVSHQFYLPPGKKAEDAERMDSEIRFAGNVDAVSAAVLESFDYAALGHIHKPMKAGSDRLRYCGTPLACSVSEAGQEKGIAVVEMKGKGDISFRTIPLIPLREIRILRGTTEELLAQSCQDYVKLILTDEADSSMSDVQIRLHAAFPYLLEITRENERKADYTEEDHQGDLAIPDPFGLCCSFLKITDEEEMKIIRDVINAVKEGGRADR